MLLSGKHPSLLFTFLGEAPKPSHKYPLLRGVFDSSGYQLVFGDFMMTSFYLYLYYPFIEG